MRHPYIPPEEQEHLGPPGDWQPYPEDPKTRWSLHICSPWSGDCSMRGVRLNAWTPWGFLIVGLFGGQVLCHGKFVNVCFEKHGESH